MFSAIKVHHPTLSKCCLSQFDYISSLHDLMHDFKLWLVFLWIIMIHVTYIIYIMYIIYNIYVQNTWAFHHFPGVFKPPSDGPWAFQGPCSSKTAARFCNSSMPYLLARYGGVVEPSYSCGPQRKGGGILYLEVSINRGTPKLMVYNGKPY